MKRLQKAIFERNITYITSFFFNNDLTLKNVVKMESELWDYKESLPPIGKDHLLYWAKIAKHVLAFHNNNGGILIFGVKDNFIVCKTKSEIDSKKFNDQLKKFLPDTIYVDFLNYYRDENGLGIGIAIIPPRGPIIQKFISNSIKKENNKFLFDKGFSAIRQGDQSIILNKAEAEKYNKENAMQTENTIYAVNTNGFRILAPEYSNFVYRKTPCEEILNGLQDKRTSVVSITGIGGIGKTALATWAVMNFYENNHNFFDFIISVTAKDRELSQSGINSIYPTIKSFENVLNAIFDVLGFQECKKLSIEEQEKSVFELLEESNGLLYIDNLETIEDDRIINFLDKLPYGVKAITTSRRNRVRFSVYPINIGKMTIEECSEYLYKLSSETGLFYLQKISKEEAREIAENIDGIPLAIKWCVKRSASIQELLFMTREIKNSGRDSEELLEFSYRRIFDKMKDSEKSILFTLACFNRGVETNLILFVCNKHSDIEESLTLLYNDSLILKTFNDQNNSYEYSLMPLTRNFILNQFKIDKINERKIRNRIEMYYEAKDISDLNERESIKILRNTGKDSCSVYITLSELAKKEGNYEVAEKHLKSALSQNKINFKANWLLGELYRHELKQISEALHYYQLAENNIEKHLIESEKMIFYREYGLLLLFGKDRNCLKQAQERFLKSLDFGYDSRSLYKLLEIFEKLGQFDKIINFWEDFKNNIQNNEDKKFIYPIVIKAFDYKKDFIQRSELQKQLTNLLK